MLEALADEDEQLLTGFLLRPVNSHRPKLHWKELNDSEGMVLAEQGGAAVTSDVSWLVLRR